MGNWTKQNFFKRRNKNGQKTHEKMFTISATKETQIKTTLRFHLTPVRIPIIKNTNNNRCWHGMGKKEPSYTAGGNASLWNHSENQSIDLPYDPAIPLLGIYPKECDSGYMEERLGISLYSYPYLKLAKMLCLSYYCLCLLFSKIEEEGRIGSDLEQGGWEGEGGSGGQGDRWSNVCTYE
jgi:hypothetical protein